MKKNIKKNGLRKIEKIDFWIYICTLKIDEIFYVFLSYIQQNVLKEKSILRNVN
jgi:hypothetical protein